MFKGRITFFLAQLFLLAFLAILLTACAPAAAPSGEGLPPTTTTPTLSTGAGASQIQGYDSLVNALSAAGATVEPAGEINQPFFQVPGKKILVNGQEVQVFEYADEAARQADSSTISPDGSAIGTSMVSWIGKPSFWANGNLIVFSLDMNPDEVQRMTGVMGPSITQP